MSGSSAGYVAPAGPAQDFWRSPNNAPGSLPDGVNDATETIARQGQVGIGAAFIASNPGGALTPVAALDVSTNVNGRTGTDGRVAGVTPIYATGNIPGIGGGVNPAATPTGGVEFRHFNQTQGIGFAYDGIYATGSNGDQNFNLVNRGAGQYFRHWQTLLGGFNYDNEVGAAFTADNQGWQHRWWAGGASVAIDLLRRRTIFAGGTTGMERFWQLQRPDGAFTNHSRQTWSFTNPNTPAFSVNPNNGIGDQLLTLWGDPSATFATYAIGIKASTLASFIDGAAAHFRWYRNDVAGGTQVFGVSGLGNVTIDPLGVGPAGWASPVLRFGSEASGDGIRSQRTVVDRFQNDVEFYTGTARRGAFLASGRFYLAVVPTFATDAAAGVGGLATGELWKDATGILHIKL